MELMDHQKEASQKLGNGKILYGGTGSGKGMTVLDYYVRNESPKDIVIITTAKKRDSLDWVMEAAQFGIGSDPELTLHGVITVDSWNNIMDYTWMEGCFFVFDEQRVVGNGAWVKSFIKIARKNHWVLLSATPGDTWMDYAPVFVANSWYKSINQFKMEHVLYEPYVRFPKIKGYIGERKLERLRNDVLVEMPFARHTVRHMNWLDVGYDQNHFDMVWKRRWNIFEGRPCKDIAEVFRVMRRVVNSDQSRMDTLVSLMKVHKKLIVFYNFDYELEILRGLRGRVPVFEYNGHVKNPVPDGPEWVYLVQYVAGAEAWNCTTTNAMVLWSLTYSFKNFEQACGRIDRLDTPYTDLYYYVLLSNSVIDKMIRRALSLKKNFNERRIVAALESGVRFEQIEEWRTDEFDKNVSKSVSPNLS